LPNATDSIHICLQAPCQSTQTLFFLIRSSESTTFGATYSTANAIRPPSPPSAPQFIASLFINGPVPSALAQLRTINQIAFSTQRHRLHSFSIQRRYASVFVRSICSVGGGQAGGKLLRDKCDNINRVRGFSSGLRNIQFPLQSLPQKKTALQFTGRDSSVGIATRYGPDGPGIETRWW
jgi:hypothetical protein